jgi:hypothetical protein
MKVLNAGAIVTCVHQGQAQLQASQRTFLVDGQPLLVEGDLVGVPITGCPIPVSQTSKPCLSVVSMTVGSSRNLKIGGKAVLLDSATGVTDGVSPAGNLWSVQFAGQTKLDAS